MGCVFCGEDFACVVCRSPRAELLRLRGLYLDGYLTQGDLYTRLYRYKLDPVGTFSPRDLSGWPEWKAAMDAGATAFGSGGIET